MFSACKLAHAEEQPRDHDFVLKLGAAAERSLKDDTTSGGGTVAIERTFVENWLEIEAGFTHLRRNGNTENSIELIFKKPFQISSTAELMVGVGPSVGRRTSDGMSSDTRSVQFDIDLMVWPIRTIGWFVEPSYGYGFGPSRGERTVGVSIGVLFGF